MLDLPTNEAWIDPWMEQLTKLGVRFERGQALERYDVKGGRIRAAWVRNGGGKRSRVEADWFVNAMPVEQVTKTSRPSCSGKIRRCDGCAGCTPTGWSASGATSANRCT